MLEWIRFWITAVLLLIGLGCFLGAVVGNQRFPYVMDRIHAAGLGDTLGLLSVLLGLAVSAPSAFEMVKLLLPLVFQWMCSPVSSHFLAQIEYFTNERFYEHMDRI